MQNYITFSSRGDTINFLSHIKRAGVPATTVATPIKRADLCALSIKVDSAYLEEVRKLLASGQYHSFRGIF